jgi:multidrug efflux pump subunit AcrA (membrane-fusion protein)
MPTNNSENKQPAGRSKIAGLPRPAFWIILAVVVAAIAGGVYYYVNAQQAAAAAVTAKQATIQTATARTGNIILRASGTGTLVAAVESNLGFQTSGTLTTLNVQVGSQVKSGDLIAQLDSSNQQLALSQAQQALNQLTSASAIATAQQAVVTAKTNLINAQYVLNGASGAGTNQAANNNAQAALSLAQSKLNTAQLAYNPVSGQPLTNPGAAKLFQSLFAAQQAYNTALANYNSISAKSNPLTVGSAQASVALYTAQVTESQNLLTALTGGTVPANATGTGLNALNQAKLNLQTAQNNLAYTNLYAPISGTVLTVSNSVGDTINAGSTFVTIADLSQSELTIYMDPLDYSNIKVGYATNVVFDAVPNVTYTGKVTQISPQLVTVQGNSVVEGNVVLDAKQAAGVPPLTLPLGVTASVDIIAAQANNVILVPVQALHELSPNNYSVFLMVAGKPTLKTVTVGLQDGTFAEIKTGLKAGDVVSTGVQATQNNTQAVATP